MADFRFHHGGVNVPDLAQAIAWYERVLGFEVEKSFAIPPINASVAMMKKGPLRFEIFEVENSAPVPEERKMPNTDLRTQGNKHVAFMIDDLDAFLKEMEAKDVEIPFKVNESYGAGCFIRDCAGNLIEFVVEPNP